MPPELKKFFAEHLYILINFFIFSTQNILLGWIPCLETLQLPIDTEKFMDIIYYNEIKDFGRPQIYGIHPPQVD